jgi:hypothetical protein
MIGCWNCIGCINVNTTPTPTTAATRHQDRLGNIL